MAAILDNPEIRHNRANKYCDRDNRAENRKRFRRGVADQWIDELIREGWPSRAVRLIRAWERYCRLAKPRDIYRILRTLLDESVPPDRLGENYWWRLDADSWDRMVLLVVPLQKRLSIVKIVCREIAVSSAFISEPEVSQLDPTSWQRWLITKSIWKTDAENTRN